MNIDLDNVWGDPKFINGVPIYPVLMKDILNLYEASTCLLIPKNSMSDPKIIKMSYLSFLIEQGRYKENEHLLDKLDNLLKLVTRADFIDYDIDEKKKLIILVDGKDLIRDRDFEILREIISAQNLIETKDDSLGSDFDKAKANAKAYLSKRNGRMADLEQQIIAYRCVQKLPYDEIKNMTIYQFRKELERIDLIKSADVLQNAQYSGMVSFKDGTAIPHWLDYIKDKNPDDGVVLTGEQLKQINKKNGLVNK
ncbi:MULTISPECIES: hypothetical protein [Lysinibacillus]|uniref:hypothetical protein n=1 Tax=Lysinibacillus TaxID=400634 RepID=UPI00214B4EB8|nr:MULTISPECIES: hypothetical protein [Lysinibacillus]UUV25858.1 hypothetical protein NP781_04380 [Lysinibacillus sp. FN11]UYB48732.1 hypothetical protein OCI51_07175 [Lysinibacillus capsici]